MREACHDHAIDDHRPTADPACRRDRPNLLDARGGVDGGALRRAGAVGGDVKGDGEGVAVAEDCVEVVGVGGIDTPEKAKRLLDDGCSAVQIYTGLVFKGPGLIQNINAAV